MAFNHKRYDFWLSFGFKRSLRSLLNWSKQAKLNERIPCNLKAEVLHNFNEMFLPLDVLEKVMELDKLVTLIVAETNRYSQKKGRNFVTNAAEMKTFLGMNYIMGVNKLPTIHHYCESDDYVGNEGIRSLMTRERFKEILQNIHFVYNSKSNKETDEGCKIRQLIDHFKKVFPEAMSDDSEQTFNEHMVKFKGRAPMKQYMKNKPIKWGFKFWFRCAIKWDICRKWTCTLERSSKLCTAWEKE